MCQSFAIDFISKSQDLSSLKTRANCKPGNVWIKRAAEIRHLTLIRLLLKLKKVKHSIANVCIVGSRT